MDPKNVRFTQLTAEDLAELLDDYFIILGLILDLEIKPDTLKRHREFVRDLKAGAMDRMQSYERMFEKRAKTAGIRHDLDQTDPDRPN